MQKPKTQILTVLVVAAALVLAIATFRALRQWPKPRRDHDRHDVLWVKCRDPNCTAEYLLPLGEYYTYVEEHADPNILVPPPLVCRHCGRKTIFRAFKCAKCDVVSFRNSVPDDFADRCPNCGYSQIEVDRNKAAELRRQNTDPEPDANDQEPPFPLDRLAPVSLDKVTVIPQLKGWIICDVNAGDERLLLINPESNEVALSTSALGWQPNVIRRFDTNDVQLMALGFFSPRRTAVIYYGLARTSSIREEIDLNTSAVISSENLLDEYRLSFFIGPVPLSAEKQGLVEVLFEKYALGHAVCLGHTDPNRLLVYNHDDQLYYLDLEAKRPQEIDEHVYAEGNAEFAPRWAGYKDLVTYFKRLERDPSDTLELYLANTRGASKCIYRISLKDKQATRVFNLFIASPKEAWATLVSPKPQVPLPAMIELEYKDTDY